MGQCWFCGVQTDQVFQCPQCQKSYCNLHAEPTSHDCPMVPIVDIARMPASSYVAPVNSTPIPLNAPHAAVYTPSADEIARSTQDGSYIWHGKADIPEDAFAPDSGIDMKMVFWQKGSEPAHLLIGGLLMFIFGYVTFSTLTTLFYPIVIDVWYVVLIAGIFTGSFLSHEFGHRQVARHYKMQTKFRLFTIGMVITVASIGIAFFGLLFTGSPYPGFGFPGAVVVIGLEKISRETGECKVAGPLVNLTIGTTLFFLGIYGLSIGIAFPLNFVLYYAAYFNFMLGAFNMIPVGALDGQNIFKWKPAVWIVVAAILVAFLVYEIVSFTNGPFILLTFLGIKV